LRRLLPALTIALGLVAAVRAVRFAKEPTARTARGEREYFAWAWPDRHFAERLKAVAPYLEDGELYSISIPSGSLEPWWVHLVADYALPSQQLVAVEAGPQRRPSPHLTGLVFDASGNVSIRRPRRVGRP
jgi:hypothetical protein